MNQDKLKILRMLEDGRINSYEALELLSVIGEEDENGSRAIGKMKRRGKELKIEIISGDKKREIAVDMNEIFVSALMSRINTELKYNGVNLFTEELKIIRDRILSGRKVVLERENSVVNVFVD